MNKKIATIGIMGVVFLLGMTSTYAEVMPSSTGGQNSIQVTASPISISPVSQATGDEDTATTSTCLTLTSGNLRFRSKDATTNGEVSDLQDFLVAASVLKTQVTGFFGLSTFSAVKQFQKMSGLNPTGYVGKMTKAKIKEVSCNGGQLGTGDQGMGNKKGDNQNGSQEGRREGNQGKRGEMNDPNHNMHIKMSSSTAPIGVCTMEARLCPDGRMMPRNPNNCEWLAFKCGELGKASNTEMMHDMMKQYPHVEASSSDMRGTQLGMPPEKGASRVGTTTPPMTPVMKMCTDEVYKCPNGKFVPRNPKTCEFMTSLCNATSTMSDMPRMDKYPPVPVSAQ